MLALSFSSQFFQMIARRNAQVIDICGCVEHKQFTYSSHLQRLAPFSGVGSVKQLFRLFAIKTSYHLNSNVSR
jgi:hypothetical protein